MFGVELVLLNKQFQFHSQIANYLNIIQLLEQLQIFVTLDMLNVSYNIN